MIDINGTNLLAAIVVIVAIPASMVIFFMACVLLNCVYFKYIRRGTFRSSGSLDNNDPEHSFVLEINTLEMEELPNRK